MSGETRAAEVARAALAAVRGKAAPVGDEVRQLMADAAIGRAIREAAETRLDRPRLHISWDDGRGGCDGMWIEPEPLYVERETLARAAEELLDAAVPSPSTGEHTR